MLSEAHRKYRAVPPVELPDRRWPSERLGRAPIWASTDLRDGNQALFEPMGLERKLRFFQLLCEMGFREIEVGFPSASQLEFDFVRLIIEGGHIPERVTIGVLTPAREPLIERTIESLQGAARAIVHVYNATSPRFRSTVFGMSEQQVLDLATTSVAQVRRATDTRPETAWQLEYSPETFTATELSFSKRICDAVTEVWGATPQRRVILNLPATVEISTPNVYADQIEWMHRHLSRRESVVLSVHPHNDRGCGVAAAELAQMAGAERVEGCLFGNGERTGNVDLVTLALNLYSQGIDPQLDFSDIHRIARTVEHCTQLPIHPRHPYAGDLVFTAFSGSHQDAIRKGMAAQAALPPDAIWDVPYLPIDPRDIGRSYDALVRINSQSGKGGIAFLLEQDHGLALPRRLQVEFSSIVQQRADAQGSEISSEELWRMFSAEYLHPQPQVALLEYHSGCETASARAPTRLSARVRIAGDTLDLIGEGEGPIAAFVHALGLPLRVHSYEEHALGTGARAQAAAYVELSPVGGTVNRFGVGIHANILTAALQALCSATNRVLEALTPSERSDWLRARAGGGPGAATEEQHISASVIQPGA